MKEKPTKCSKEIKFRALKTPHLTVFCFLPNWTTSLANLCPQNMPQAFAFFFLPFWVKNWNFQIFLKNDGEPMEGRKRAGLWGKQNPVQGVPRVLFGQIFSGGWILLPAVENSWEELSIEGSGHVNLTSHGPLGWWNSSAGSRTVSQTAVWSRSLGHGFQCKLSLAKLTSYKLEKNPDHGLLEQTS